LETRTSAVKVRLGLILSRVAGLAYIDKDSLRQLNLLNQQSYLAVWAMMHKTRDIPVSFAVDTEIRAIFEGNRRDLLKIFQGEADEMEAGFGKIKLNLTEDLRRIIRLSDNVQGEARQP
jgi:hypothetical protein